MTSRKFLGLVVFFLVFGSIMVQPCAAKEPAVEVASDRDGAARAKILLDRAANYVKQNGAVAIPAFSRAGEFLDGDLYVYVLDKDGVMQSSGGSSSTYIGRSMMDVRDSDGKEFFREMINGAREKGGGTIEYRWLNLRHGKVERKVTYYQTVGKYIIAVGYYVPRATPEQAKSILWRAVDEVKRNSAEAFAQFNDLNGGFVQDDSYVFVIGIKDQLMYAHGAMPRLVGRRVADLTDVEGKMIIRKMVEIATKNGEGTLTYKWRNPVTGEIEKKRTFLQKVGGYIVAVGYYEP